jgi:hypothetical protein
VGKALRLVDEKTVALLAEDGWSSYKFIRIGKTTGTTSSEIFDKPLMEYVAAFIRKSGNRGEWLILFFINI